MASLPSLVPLLTIFTVLSSSVWESAGQPPLPTGLRQPTAPQAMPCDNTRACRIPPIGDLVLGRTIYASDTCGMDGPERFCFRDSNKTCETCDASDPALRHTAEYLTDPQLGKAQEDWTWWQSEAGVNEVDLRIDFGGIVHLSHATLTWKSVRPRCMVIERSIDHGVTWHVYQHFAKSCQQCFGLPEVFGPVPVSQRGNSSIFSLGCTSRYAPGSQTTSNEVGFVPLDALFQDEKLDPYSHLVQGVQQLTNLRIRFTRLETSGDKFVNETSPDANKYYYAIYNLIIKGRCFCNGHADRCSPADAEAPTTSSLPGQRAVSLACSCQHNTEGEDCGLCKPLYRDMPWTPGQLLDPNTCKPCECNGFASSCHFDGDRLEETNGTSGGVCDECSSYRTGPNCEQCVDGFYFLDGADTKDPGACQVCVCFSGGSEDGLCQKTGSTAGQCRCKANVAGSACAECKEGYYGLNNDDPLGCKSCDCNSDGTVNGSSSCDAVTGQCQCKENAEGRQCNRCKHGFSELSAADPLGCGSCMCDIGGSLSQQCDKDTKLCPCRPNISGRRCDIVEPGFYYESFQQLLQFPAEGGKVSPSGTLIPNDAVPPSGHYVQLPAGASVTVNVFDVPRTMPYTIGIILAGDDVPSANRSVSVRITPIMVNGSGLVDAGVTASDPGIATCSDQPEGTMGISQLLPAGEVAQLVMFDTRVCLQAGQQYTVEVTHYGPTDGSTVINLDTVHLLPTGSSTFRPIVNDFILDGCSLLLLRNATQEEPESDGECELHEFSLSAILNNGTIACDCDVDGSTSDICHRYNGQCPCLPGVTGRRCERCYPYHYVEMNVTGCQECNCSSSGSAHMQCDVDSGQCPCLANAIGRTCDRCLENHYPYRDVERDVGCLACSCNPEGSVSLQCSAAEDNPSLPQCQCRPGVDGHRCDQCQAGFWNLTSSGCQPCNCNPAGSQGIECDEMTGQCMSKPNVMGLKADTCKPGYIYLHALNPDGCIKCFGNGMSDVCEPADNFEVAIAESKLMESDTDGWTFAHGAMEAAENDSTPILLEPGSSVTFYAPDKFLGDRRTAFSQQLLFSLEGLVGSSAFITVMLERKTTPRHTLYYEIIGDSLMKPDFSINLLRHGWSVFSLAGEMASDAQLRMTLADLSALTITVSLPKTADQDRNVSLSYVKMTYAVRSSNGSGVDVASGEPVDLSGAEPDDSVGWVERSTCPMQYEGETCQMCAPGFTREPSFGSEFDMCLPCFDLCQVLSNEACHPQSGVCQSCTNHTTGDYCQLCEPLYYQKGLFEGCLECPCPGNGIQFADDGCTGNVETGMPTCACNEGHGGPNCAECLPGFYGQPADYPEPCQRCSCNNNTDPLEEDFCDRRYGDCLDCLYNTGGPTCGRCADGYYGDALNRTCQPCNCDVDGSNSDVCDYVTGQCRCKANTVNRQCDKCAPDHYGIASGVGCKACNCCEAGSNSTQCDLVSGHCKCLAGVEGEKCCSCRDEFWGFTPGSGTEPAIEGCRACDCSVGGSTSAVCDKMSGVCPCKLTSLGDKCDRCSAGTYGPPDCFDCGQCFNNWNITMSDVSIQVRELATRARRLREGGASGTYNITFVKIKDTLTTSGYILDGAFQDTSILADIRQGIKRIEYDILYLDDNHSANLSKLVDEVTELQGMFENAENETFERVFALIDSLNQRMGVIMPPEVADLQRARTAFSNSQALTRRAEMLDQPNFDGGKLFEETIQLLDDINSTLASTRYRGLFRDNSRLFNNLYDRMFAPGGSIETSVSALDRLLCGSDSRSDSDGCPANAECGGVRCAQCLMGTSCDTAASNANRAVVLAKNTLETITLRSQRIQSLMTTIARLDTLAKEQSVRARTALSQATSIESQGATQHNTAYELLVILQERLAESRTSRDATLKILSDLRQDLMSPDNSIVMAELVAAIQSALAGVDQAEVDTILEDTESILAMAMTVLQEAIRTDDDAEVDLFDAIHLSGRLQQARVFQDEIVDLLVQVNATELAIRVKHAESSSSLSLAESFLRASIVDVEAAQSVMNRMEGIMVDEIEPSLDNLVTNVNNVSNLAAGVTQRASMLDDRTVQLLEDLDEQETRLNGRLARSQALFNAAAATRKEMDEFRLRAEIVYNTTIDNRRRLVEIETAMLLLPDELDAAVQSIAAKDKLQLTCQFP